MLWHAVACLEMRTDTTAAVCTATDAVVSCFDLTPTLCHHFRCQRLLRDQYLTCKNNPLLVQAPHAQRPCVAGGARGFRKAQIDLGGGGQKRGRAHTLVRLHTCYVHQWCTRSHDVVNKAMDDADCSSTGTVLLRAWCSRGECSSTIVVVGRETRPHSPVISANRP